MTWGANDTHCHRGHDLRLPRAIGTDSAAGNRFCRLCRNLRKLRSIARARARGSHCRHCRKLLVGGRAWAYCSSACERAVRGDRKRQSDNHAAAPINTVNLLDLYERLDRAQTSWERADIRALIDAEKARQAAHDHRPAP